jgi:hypothetical protein
VLAPDALSVAEDPGQIDTFVGEVLTVGKELTVTTAVPLEEQPADVVTVTFNTTGLVVLGVQVMFAVPPPAVIVPLLIVQP